ncbi:MAG: HD-GYP domain-containing protein [Actinobacteria bacterium]|nr:MAG: HD-GYP domain-containing protein [Actinomycetota bacterium]
MNQAAKLSNIENELLSRMRVSRFFTEVLNALSLAIDLEFGKKLNHSRRVAYLSTKLADRVCPEHRVQVFYAGLLHDIGTVSLPNNIVHYFNISKVRPSEELKIRNHPQAAAQVLRRVVGLPDLHLAADYILEHHENWNGSGFPAAKKNKDILLGSQIIRACDELDVVIWRQGKKASLAKIKKWVDQQADKVFSKELSAYLLELINQQTLRTLLNEELLEKEVKRIQDGLPPFKMVPFSDSIGSLLKMVAIIIDTKHHYTAGHSERVAEYSIQIAKELNLNHDEITKVKWAGLLHDIGKISVPTSILAKTSLLTSRERDEIEKHAAYTIDILSTISDIAELAGVAGGHHERFDGTGYPKRLKGDVIPIGARIICVADALDAMTSSRPYRRVTTFHEALEVIKKSSGAQFDPNIVYAAYQVFNK